MNKNATESRQKKLTPKMSCQQNQYKKNISRTFQSVFTLRSYDLQCVVRNLVLVTRREVPFVDCIRTSIIRQ